MKRSACVIVAALAIGCAGQREQAHETPTVPPECLIYYEDSRHPYAPTEFPVEVVIDTDIPNHTIQLFLDAVDRWNNRLDSEVLFATITADLYGMHGDCNFATVTTSMVLPEDDVGITTYGNCAADHVSIIGAVLTDEEVRTTASHELGHVLGAPHDDNDPTSVMYPRVGPYEQFISERSACVVQIIMTAAGAGKAAP